MTYVITGLVSHCRTMPRFVTLPCPSVTGIPPEWSLETIASSFGTRKIEHWGELELRNCVLVGKGAGGWIASRVRRHWRGLGRCAYAGVWNKCTLTDLGMVSYAEIDQKIIELTTSH